LPFNCQKEKEKIVLATPLREVSFSYPPFPHMGNTEIPPKKEKKEKKRRREIIIDSCMYMATTPHPWLKLEQMSELMSVCPVPCC